MAGSWPVFNQPFWQMKYEYLLFNLIILAGPLLGGLLYPKTKWPKLKHILLSLIPPAIVFILADFLATGVFWRFNDTYTTGIKLLNLPFEEILFFFTVPFACLFLWINWPRNSRLVFHHQWLTVIGLGLVTLGLVSLSIGWYYSGIIFTLFGIWLIFDSRQRLPLSNRLDYLTFLALVFVLTMVFNGYLTARPVVIYNPYYKTNLNLFTIPVEDIIYGFILINLNLLIYTTVTNHRVRPLPVSDPM